MKQHLSPTVFEHVISQDRLEMIKSFITDKRLNYKPPYQREYVWTVQKATYFIETIFKLGDFPPVTIYEFQDVREVIDGRQRCETIDKFLKDELTLRSSGLDHLWFLADKRWSQLSPKLQERFLQTRMRVIVIRFTSESDFNRAMEAPLKRELFRRYNRGLTPLKKAEVYKAQYLRDEINLFFKRRLSEDGSFYDQVKDLFEHRAKNLELLMQMIRQVLVLKNIPINHFVSEKDDIINRYYDLLAYENSENEKVREVFGKFQEKIVVLARLKLALNKETRKGNGLLFECLYWALSIMEAEKVPLERVNSPAFRDKLIAFLVKNIRLFGPTQRNYYGGVKTRYQRLAEHFSQQLKSDWGKYLRDDTFLAADKERMARYMKERATLELDRVQFSKPEPTSWTIRDILDMMARKKFDLCPPYQRKEVITIVKASSLIESILKNLSIHPIHVYIREDGVYEVIDGQQRIWAILAFLNEGHLSPEGELTKSKNNNFALRLRTGFMQELDGKRFMELSEQDRERILDFKLHFIEIRQDRDPEFRPEELFKRLNYKPFPIKEHSFEFWNAYGDQEVIGDVRTIFRKNKWLYLHKKDVRMVNEELLMFLVYMEYATKNLPRNVESVKEVLGLYFRDGNIQIQLKNKANVTRVLENDLLRQDLLVACKEFETGLLSKIKTLVSPKESKNTDETMGRQLDNFLNARGTRKMVHFWILWIMLRGINTQTCYYNRDGVRAEIEQLVAITREAQSLEEFDRAIEGAWSRASKYKFIPMQPPGHQHSA